MMEPTVQDLVNNNLPVTREMYELTATGHDPTLLPGLEETMPAYVRNDELKDIPTSDPDYYRIVEMMEDFPHLTVESVRRALKHLV